MRDLFALEPYVTIHMNAKDRKEMDDFYKKQNGFQRPKNIPPPNFNYPNFHPTMNMNFGMGVNANQMMYNPNNAMNMNSGMNTNMGNPAMNMGMNR